MFTTLGDTLMSRYYVFYATLLYGEYSTYKVFPTLPDGVYIYKPEDNNKHNIHGWIPIQVPVNKLEGK